MSRLDEAVLAAEEIPGWMDAGELCWLGERAAEHERIVEVGSWQGRSTKVLAAMTEGIVFSVDDLTGEADSPEPDLHDLFCVNLKDEIASGKVRIVRESSVKAAAAVKRADMAFIDACHEYPAPKQDIEVWAAVVNGGLLCGHDADYPGVERSLAEALPDHKRPIGSIWVA